MPIHVDKERQTPTHSRATDATSTKKNVPTSFVDNRPEALEQQELQAMANNSPQALEGAKFQEMAEQHAQQSVNKTGIPDDLKTNTENVLKVSLNKIKVHYNSKEPEKVDAHSLTKGNHVYIGPGREEDLPHELIHAGKHQEEGVQPTMTTQDGVGINGDVSKEKEAETLATKAKRNQSVPSKQPLQPLAENNSNTATVQLLHAREMVVGNTYRYQLDGGERTAQLVGITHGGYYHFDNRDRVRGAANIEEDVTDQHMQVDEPMAAAPLYHDEVPVGAAEEQLACWNWAIYALDQAITVSEIDKVFRLLESQVAFERGGNEFLPTVAEGAAIENLMVDFRHLCANRVTNGEITEARATEMATEYRASIERVRVQVGAIRDAINQVDLAEVSKQDITREYNYRLTEVILENAGFEVLPRGTANTWMVGQHVQQGTFGWEHWWLRTPDGQYIDHFPGQGNGIRRNNIMPFGYGEDDIIEVPVRDIKPEHRAQAQLPED